MLELSCRKLKSWSLLALCCICMAGNSRGGESVHTYIPQDLYDCYLDLGRNLGPEVIAKMKSGSTNDILHAYPQVTQLMKERWELGRKSRLTDYFKKLGVRSPDEITGLVLKGYWHYLNDAPYNLSQNLNTRLGSRQSPPVY